MIFCTEWICHVCCQFNSRLFKLSNFDISNHRDIVMTIHDIQKMSETYVKKMNESMVVFSILLPPLRMADTTHCQSARLLHSAVTMAVQADNDFFHQISRHPKLAIVTGKMLLSFLIHLYSSLNRCLKANMVLYLLSKNRNLPLEMRSVTAKRQLPFIS